MEVSAEVLIGVTALVLVTRAIRGDLHWNGDADVLAFVLFIGGWVYLLTRRRAVGHKKLGERLAFRLGKTLNSIGRDRSSRRIPTRSDDFPSLFG